jgi:DNA-binding LacI/PurR family transcriptional regulator
MKMEDIARMAGVSKSAVSLALSGKPGIGTETRDRILHIAKENGYAIKSRSGKPDTGTKSLTLLVLANSGIVLDKYYQQPFFRELIHFIEERCRLKGCTLVFSAIEIEHYERDVAVFVEERLTDGVILLGTNLSRAQIQELAGLLPNLVVLDTCYETLPVHFVEINNFLGGYQAGAHICESGHREIGYLASDVRIHNFEERKRGFNAALEEYGLSSGGCTAFAVAPTILTSQEALKKQINDYLSTGRKLPSVFYCECDYIAISAMKTLAELGYRIPEDISLVGFDNISEATIITPELTTVHVEKEIMSRLAVDLLIESIENDTLPKMKIKVDTQLVKRLSCKTV